MRASTTPWAMRLRLEKLQLHGALVGHGGPLRAQVPQAACERCLLNQIEYAAVRLRSAAYIVSLCSIGLCRMLPATTMHVSCGRTALSCR